MTHDQFVHGVAALAVIYGSAIVVAAVVAAGIALAWRVSEWLDARGRR